jgi:hypothetical protein
MAPKKAPKKTKTPHPDVETNAPALSSAPPSLYTSDSPPVDQSTPLRTDANNNERMKWSAEMLEALVECVYSVFKDGRAADNRFKKESWVEASDAVMRVYKGPGVVG